MSLTIQKPQTQTIFSINSQFGVFALWICLNISPGNLNIIFSKYLFVTNLHISKTNMKSTNQKT